MTIELVILLTLTAFIYAPEQGQQGNGISSRIKKTFQEAGPHLGGRIERQLDTAAGFQEIAIDIDKNPLGWSGR